ncbi:MAG: ATP-binding cassette domain-containing protein [Armatimonadetes bacterium]|nr:ATP-binding cassette domain-containing protein [Armatimonadota bacterium]
MSVVLSIDALVLAKGCRSLTLDLGPGDKLAVVGLSGSGKTQLAETVAGRAKPFSGEVVRRGAVVEAWHGGHNRRATPLSLAQKAQGGRDDGMCAQVLTALGLWDDREAAVANLPVGMMVACDLLPCLLAPADLAVIDGQLDLLDPWTLDRVLASVEELSGQGRSFVVVTNNLWLAERLGSLVVLRGCEAVYAGSVGDLVRRGRPSEVTVTTSDPSTAQSMADPFMLSIQKTADGLHLTAHDGQALAARLLTEGYGSVKAVVVKEPAFADVLLELM